MTKATLTTIIVLLALPVVLAAPFDADAQNTDLGASLRAIRPLMRNDPYRAVSMLKALKVQYPQHSRVYIMLGDTYQVIGDHEAARQAYRECLQIDPNNHQAGAALGMLFIKDDRAEEGEAVFRDMLSRTSFSVATYRSIGMALSRAGYYDLALKWYRDGRDQHPVGSSYVLTLDIAYLQSTLGHYEAAVREYLTLMETSPKHHRLAQQKILEMLRSHPDERPELMAVLKEDTKHDAPSRRYVMAVLAVAYLELKQFENALDMALQADEFGTTDGAVVFNLAERVVAEYDRRPIGANVQYYDVGLRALAAYVATYPSGPQIPQVRLMQTDLWIDRAAGRVPGATTPPADAAADNAMAALDWLIESYPGSEFAERAMLSKGELLFRVRKDIDGALAVYQSGMKSARTYHDEFAEDLGRLYLVAGRFDEAQGHFERLQKSNSEPMHETAGYYTGLMLAFQNEYESARDTLTALAETNPASKHTNNAIELAWVIEEGLRDEQHVLGHYIDAVRAELAGDTLQVVNHLSLVLQEPKETRLRQRAIIKLGETYEFAGRYRQSVRTLELFIGDYPRDILMPDVYRRIARVYEHGYQDPELALETYERILISYPHYIFLDEVRRDVARLRVDVDEMGVLQ